MTLKELHSPPNTSKQCCVEKVLDLSLFSQHALRLWTLILLLKHSQNLNTAAAANPKSRRKTKRRNLGLSAPSRNKVDNKICTFTFFLRSLCCNELLFNLKFEGHLKIENL